VPLDASGTFGSVPGPDSIPVARFGMSTILPTATAGLIESSGHTRVDPATVQPARGDASHTSQRQFDLALLFYQKPQRLLHRVHQHEGFADNLIPRERLSSSSTPKRWYRVGLAACGDHSAADLRVDETKFGVWMDHLSLVLSETRERRTGQTL
jgi:hypothetical protein